MFSESKTSFHTSFHKHTLGDCYTEMMRLGMVEVTKVKETQIPISITEEHRSIGLHYSGLLESIIFFCICSYSAIHQEYAPCKQKLIRLTHLTIECSVLGIAPGTQLVHNKYLFNE